MPASAAVPETGAPTAALSIRGLRHALAGDLALDVPALDVPRGAFTLLMGASAAGKSALLKLLARLDDGYFPRVRDTRGRAWLRSDKLGGGGAVDLLALDRRALAERRVLGPVLGFVFQQEALFTFCDARENVAWPLRELGWAPRDAAERADELLERVGLAAHRAVATLSGGERKKLALARALGPDPDVLLLDEPFTGLDPLAQRALVEMVAAERGRRTAVIVSHQRLPYEALAEHVVLMADGRVAAAGPRAALDEVVRGFHEGRAFDEGRVDPAVRAAPHAAAAPHDTGGEGREETDDG